MAQEIPKSMFNLPDYPYTPYPLLGGTAQTKSESHDKEEHSNTNVNGTLDDYNFDPSIPKLFLDTNETFLRNTPKSRLASEDARRYLPGGSTRSSLWSAPYGLTFASGAGSTVTDLDGRTYADFLGEYSAGIFGHSNPRIQAAVHEALSRGWNLGGQSQYEQELARRVVSRFSPVMDMVRFTNSGTEANTMALATALAWHHAPASSQSSSPVRNKILVFEGGYHGGTLRFPHVAHTDSASLRLQENPWLPDDPINLPHAFIVAPYDDADAVTSLVRQHLADTLAAVLVEPMQGNAGARPSSSAFLKTLRTLCDETGALLIFDEVQTSRLGPRGLGLEVGVAPDLMTLGKWVGGGMTFGAFGGKRPYMAQFDLSGRSGPAGKTRQAANLTHAGTFNNNVVTMAAGLAALELLTADRLSTLNARGDELHRRVDEVLHETGLGSRDNMWISGVGSILAIGFAGTWAKQLHAAWFQFLLERGIYISPRGFMALSVEVTQVQVDKFVEATRVFVGEFKDLIGAR